MSGVLTSDLTDFPPLPWIATFRPVDTEQAQALGELLASAVAWRQQGSIAHTQPNLRHVRAVDAWLALAD